MHILLELDLSLFVLLFFVAGISGLLVRIDQWVEGDFTHPKKNGGKIDWMRSFWSYILIFVLSGLSGTMVSVGIGYFFELADTSVLLFSAVMIGAVGKLIFYKLVEWVHNKFDENVYGKVAYKGTRKNSRRSAGDSSSSRRS